LTNQIFIDTSAFYAINDRSDKNNPVAAKIYSDLIKKEYQFVLTDHIVSETATLLRRRLGYNQSVNFLDAIEDGEAVELFKLIFSNSALSKIARDYFNKFSSDKISFTDSISFAVMNKLKIKSVFAYDNHFAEAGFTLIS
jgi:hypothetical protein